MELKSESFDLYLRIFIDKVFKFCLRKYINSAVIIVYSQFYDSSELEVSEFLGIC